MSVTKAALQLLLAAQCLFTGCAPYIHYASNRGAYGDPPAQQPAASLQKGHSSRMGQATAPKTGNRAPKPAADTAAADTAAPAAVTAVGGDSSGAVPSFEPEGLANYFSDELQGKKTASGEICDKTVMTAAHRTFPFGTIVKVTNLENGQSTIVRINDRGPFTPGVIIDVSYAAGLELDIIRAGKGRVKIEIVESAK